MSLHDTPQCPRLLPAHAFATVLNWGLYLYLLHDTELYYNMNNVAQIVWFLFVLLSHSHSLFSSLSHCFCFWQHFTDLPYAHVRKLYFLFFVVHNTNCWISFIFISLVPPGWPLSIACCCWTFGLTIKQVLLLARTRLTFLLLWQPSTKWIFNA